MSAHPTVALIGRPNVGKSSLFNALNDEGRQAVTGNSPGVTRDRHYGRMEWDNGFISLIDTGGLHCQVLEEDGGGKNHYFNLTTTQSQQAIKESDLVLLVMDIREGRLPMDDEIADYLRSQNKDFWPVLNKCDSPKQEDLATDFYALGSSNDNIFPVSAAHQRGLTELKQQIAKKLLLPSSTQDKISTKAKAVLLGGPNVGKSTLLNRLMKSPRALVSPFPGTTIDPMEEIIDIGGERIGIIDTAGIRKKRLITDPIEKASVGQSLAGMDNADIVLYMIDVIKGPGHQDRRLIDLALERGKSVIIILNKTDLLTEKLQAYPKNVIPYSEYCALVPISAQKGTGLKKLFQTLKKTVHARQKKISTGFFNRVLQRTLERNPPKEIKIKYGVQVKSSPPTFLLHTNSSRPMPNNYHRYLIREMRRQLEFDNTPVHLIYRHK